MNFVDVLDRQPRTLLLLAGFLLIAVVGLMDFTTGYELSFSVFYVLPISLVTWAGGRRLGLLASIASGAMWLSADFATGHTYSNPYIPFWNCLIRFTFFVIITLLLSEVRYLMQREKSLARVDPLTGAANTRFFYELAQMEMDRCRRHGHAFSMAYIDLDNFKGVNDQFGHAMGDQVLRSVVSTATTGLRKIDIVARLGGDEFALLLPETNEEAARVALTKLQQRLAAAMQHGNWPITFSIGVLTCNVPPETTDELVKMSDNLMYTVKHESKNAIKYAAYAG